MLLVPLLKLWDADLTVPLYREIDVEFVRMLVHEIDENGNFFENRRLGAPFGQELRDYPEVDTISHLLLRLLTLVTSDPDVALNLFYILTFPLVSLAAYAVLRGRVGTWPALVAAVLFAFLPYHLERNESHLFLSAYWAVPFACHLMLVLLAGEPAFERRPGRSGIAAWGSRRTLLTLGACLVVGSTWFYYAAYALFLLVAAAVLALIVRPSKATLFTSGAVIAVTGVVLALNLAPYAVHRATEGASKGYVARSGRESEFLALKLMQLALPREDHRIDALGRVSRRYEKATLPHFFTEARPAHLGAVGALGFAWLLLVVAASPLPGRASRYVRRYGPAAAGALVAFMFGTVGALGALVGYGLTTELRAWSRMSVFIAFFALLAAALALDGTTARLRRRSEALIGVVLAAVLAVGLLDQTSPADVPDHEALLRADRRTAAYVADIERRLPAGAAIFQAPYWRFPEGPYEQLRGYLHSERLRWSFGDVTGAPREWRDDLRDRPPAEVLRAAAAVGFAGVEVMRRASRDRARPFEAEVRRILGAPVVVDADGDFAFYDLRPFAERLRRRLGPARLAALRRDVLRGRPPG